MGRAQRAMLVTAAILLALAMGCGRSRSVPEITETVASKSVPSRPAKTSVLLHWMTGYTPAYPMSWSPDGTKIAITRYQPGDSPRDVPGLVSVVDVRSRKARKIALAWSRQMQPVFTGPGDELIFVPQDSGNTIVARGISSGKTRLLFRAEEGFGVGDAKISPDMAWLGVVLVGSAESQRSVVVVVDLRNGGTTRLWSGTESVVYLPPWSPDSRLMGWNVADYSGRADRNRAVAFWVAGPPAWQPRALVLPSGDPSVTRGCWAPDSARFVVGSIEQDRLRLFVVDAVKGRSTTIVNVRGWRNAYMAGCRWSPDGRWIAFGARQGAGSNGGAECVYLVRPDGGVLTKILGPARVGYAELEWSPDGRRLAFFDGESLEVAEVPQGG